MPGRKKRWNETKKRRDGFVGRREDTLAQHFDRGAHEAAVKLLLGGKKKSLKNYAVYSPAPHKYATVEIQTPMLDDEAAIEVKVLQHANEHKHDYGWQRDLVKGELNFVICRQQHNRKTATEHAIHQMRLDFKPIAP